MTLQQIYSENYTLNFINCETRAHWRRLGSKIDAQFRTVWPCKIRVEWKKYLSEFYEFGLAPNLPYTFGGRLSAIWEIRVCISKKNKRTRANYKGVL